MEGSEWLPQWTPQRPCQPPLPTPQGPPSLEEGRSEPLCTWPSSGALSTIVPWEPTATKNSLSRPLLVGRQPSDGTALLRSIWGQDHMAVAPLIDPNPHTLAPLEVSFVLGPTKENTGLAEGEQLANVPVRVHYLIWWQALVGHKEPVVQETTVPQQPREHMGMPTDLGLDPVLKVGLQRQRVSPDGTHRLLATPLLA